tara:strand:+ start:502 stop:909 length:408 start_codon:yes stop_codon:yes gene_type:complete
MKITKENLIKVIREEIGLVRMLNEGRRQYGFDLTDFKPNGFQKVLKGLGIRQKKGEEGRSSGWEWKGRGILIVTGNDPITGEYKSNSKIKRKAEKNYASYIGLEGDSKMVEKAVELIHKYASYIKNEDPKRRSYI